MKRDLYIDFAKGVATLSIIFIHTAFWSGQYYIPAEIRIFSLVFDVPIFFALSGLTSGSNIEKTLYRLLKLQITYMIFVTFLFFLDYFFKVFGLNFFGLAWLKDFYATFGSKYVPQNISTIPQWQNLGNWYLHQYTNADTFPVVMGSFWYLKIYYILSVFGVLILRFFPRHIWWFIGICLGFTLIFNIFPQYYPIGNVGYVAYYLAVFLVAHQLKGKKIGIKWIPILYGCIGISLAVLFYFWGKDAFYLMNKQKFPPKTGYILWSLFSLITVLALNKRLKISRENVINYIGKNAIFFYFAQGMSSSLVYFLVVPLKEHFSWIFLILIIYFFNVSLAICLALGLKKLDSFGWEILSFLRNKTAIR